MVRGVAMNPIDHPHGGGEGRTSGGRHPVTPWGKPTKGKRTRKNKSTDKFIIRSRHSARRSKGSEWHVRYGKVPFVDGYLLKKAERCPRSGRNEVIKTWSRRSTILPQFVGLTFGVYNGRSTFRCWCRKTWLATSSANSRRPDLLRPRRRQEGEEEVTWASRKQRSLADNEARALPRNPRQPAEAQSGRAIIRGKKVETALADLTFSRKRIAGTSRRR
jgi:hypothetical protein